MNMVSPATPDKATASAASGIVARGLSIGYEVGSGIVTVLHEIDLDVPQGRVLGIVGESGSGKSTLAYAIVRYLSSNARVLGGSLSFNGEDLLAMPAKRLNALRGSQIGMVYQDPSTALNPTMRLGEQLVEGIRFHRGGSAEDLEGGAMRLLEMVRLPDPEAMMRRFPHEISGGERQRVLIAMAFSLKPKLLIFDEATTALDATTAAGIVELIRKLQAETNVAVIYITHDLGTVAQLAHDICVIYGGRVVETGDVQSVLGSPRHPYTRMLLDSRPDPFRHQRGGKLAPVQAGPAGAPRLPPDDPLCNFRLRCAFAADICNGTPAPLKGPVLHRDACLRAGEIELGAELRVATGNASATSADGDVLLKLQDLKIRYGQHSFVSRLFGFPSKEFEAVRGIDLEIGVGKTLGLVGESGCGKSTLARALVGLSRFTGTISYGGRVMTSADDMDRAYRQSVQLIFQNADLALNPRLSVGELIGRPLLLYGLAGRGEIKRRVAELLDRVKLPSSYATRYTSQLSGGEKQRVSIARAFAASPKLIVCDEITSSLDVSVQAAILDLLTELQKESGTSYVFISHDLNVVQSIADEVAVMYLGRMIERRRMSGTTIQPPFHPYTEALLSAVPVADPSVVTRRVQADGALPNPRTPPRGCAFATRCPRKLGGICDDVFPPQQQVGSDLEILCHIPIDELSKVPPLWSRAGSSPAG